MQLEYRFDADGSPYMKIDVWSDVVCPWCYIGKRRLEKALDDFAHADQVEITWHSYQLDPGAPREATERSSDMLAKKYGGGPAAIRQMQDRVEAVAAEEGLLYRLSETMHVNTIDAHRLLHLAHEVGGNDLQGAFKEALLAAYFLSARNVADHEVLREVALEAGLPGDRVAAVLAGSEYADAVQADIAQAQSYGANGVPFFVFDAKYGISGAQPVEVFADVLAKAWADAHPAIQVVGQDDADACGPDGCAI